MKYWQWSSDSGWCERMIWCRSVSISSYTTYTSLKLWREEGLRMSLIWMTFSCFKCRSSFISRRVRLASMLLSKALDIFLMAMRSRVSELWAELVQHAMRGQVRARGGACRCAMRTIRRRRRPCRSA
jgi:hypothetical protein